jgi:hypothetical protein
MTTAAQTKAIPIVIFMIVPRYFSVQIYPMTHRASNTATIHCQRGDDPVIQDLPQVSLSRTLTRFSAKQLAAALRLVGARSVEAAN